MATTEWGLFEWGSAEWGSTEGGASPAMEAAGSFEMSGSAQLQTFQSFDALGVFTLAAAADLTTEILLAAAGLMVLGGTAELRTAKTGKKLATCGHVLAADCDQWLLDPFTRET